MEECALTPLINDRLRISQKRKLKIPRKIEILKTCYLGGLEPVTLRSIVQRGTTEPTTAAAEATSDHCYLCSNLINVYCS